MHDWQDEILFGVPSTKLGKQPSRFAFVSRFTHFLIDCSVPLLVGTGISAFLFLFLPEFLSYTALQRTTTEYALQMTYSNLSWRTDALLHGDFSRFTDWGYPLLGAMIGMYLRLLYKTDL